MKHKLKRLSAFLAALLLTLGAFLSVAPVFGPVYASDDPLAREEEVPAWKLTDMYTEAFPDEDVYGSPARYQVSQFEHVMVYEDAVHTAKFGELPNLLEDGQAFQISLSDHISNDDNGSTGLMNIVEIVAYDSKGSVLEKGTRTASRSLPTEIRNTAPVSARTRTT